MRSKIVPNSAWRFTDNVGTARRRRLLETPFENICKKILQEFWLLEHRREKGRDYPGARVCMKLEMSKETVDLFHNGAGGYRAQYYLGTAQGELANRYVINFVLQKLLQQCSSNPKRTCDPQFIEASLRDGDAKIWIYQGVWMRALSRADRRLLVRRWIDNGETKVPRKARIPIWSKATPCDETRLEIKGGFVDDTSRSLGIKTKKCRSRELHDFGFT